MTVPVTFRQLAGTFYFTENVNIKKFMEGGFNREKKNFSTCCRDFDTGGIIRRGLRLLGCNVPTRTAQIAKKII
jgi:hypothetical protein